MRDIIEDIKNLKDELEIKIQDYSTQNFSNDIEPPIYGKTNDEFSVYYQEKPFQREVGRIKR